MRDLDLGGMRVGGHLGDDVTRRAWEVGSGENVAAKVQDVQLRHVRQNHQNGGRLQRLWRDVRVGIQTLLSLQLRHF